MTDMLVNIAQNSITELGNPGDLSFCLWKGLLILASNTLQKADISYNLDQEVAESRPDSYDGHSGTNLSIIRYKVRLSYYVMR